MTLTPLNHCRSCDQDFTGVAYFDRHRVGHYSPGDYKGEPQDWTPELGRRCLTTGEMKDLGWEKNTRGRWFDPAEVARGLSALHRSSQTRSEVAATAA